MTATFTLTTSSLTTGTHTITLAAQDDEGEWSDEGSVKLVVGVKWVYLPLVMRGF